MQEAHQHGLGSIPCSAIRQLVASFQLSFQNAAVAPTNRFFRSRPQYLPSRVKYHSG